MSHQKYKKIKFWTAMAMLLGSVVGIGVFFKNGSVIKSNDYNGWGTLIAWIIGGLVSLSIAIPYSEIGAIESGSNPGLSGWAKATCGKKIGNFVRFNYIFFYEGILCVVLSIFFSESLINIFVIAFNVNQPIILVHIMIGVVVICFVMFFNYMYLNFFVWSQRLSIFFKFIPLIFVVILGIAFFNTNKLPTSLTNGYSGHNLFGVGGGLFSFEGMLASLPMVLFAFDAFLNVGTITKKVENGTKKVPIIIILGISIIIVLYLLISVSLLIHGVGYVSGAPFGNSSEHLGLFGQIFSANVAKWTGIFTMIFIAISVYGVFNAISMSIVELLDNAIEDNFIFGANRLKSKWGKNNTVFFYLGFIMIFWILFISIPSLISNSDASIDAISNFPTLFFFVIYILVIGCYVRKRKFLQTPKINNKIFYAAIVIALIGTLFIVGWQTFYEFTYKSFANPSQNMNAFGLFKTPTSIYRWQFLIIFAIVLAIFFSFPIVHEKIKAKWQKEIEFTQVRVIKNL